MFGGINLPSPLVSQPYRQPCKVVPSLESEAYCSRPSGEHTALGNPICDECHAALYDAALVAGPEVQVLGGFSV